MTHKNISHAWWIEIYRGKPAFVSRSGGSIPVTKELYTILSEGVKYQPFMEEPLYYSPLILPEHRFNIFNVKRKIKRIINFPDTTNDCLLFAGILSQKQLSLVQYHPDVFVYFTFLEPSAWSSAVSFEIVARLSPGSQIQFFEEPSTAHVLYHSFLWNGSSLTESVQQKPVN